jgi:hypothetical protein
MAILFLTACLEPGKDGVGDYSRLLARECARLGQPCHLLALNDPQITQPLESSETVAGLESRTLRLPATLPWDERIRLSIAFRDRLGIDRVSLQFVCFAWHPKGLVPRLAAHLAPIVGGRPLHVMFHEIWVGHGEAVPFKFRLLGLAQRFILRREMRRLRPRSVSTSNPLYVGLLRGIGLEASELPLFGNIPVPAPGEKISPPAALVRAGLCDETGAHPAFMIGLFFGTLHPEWMAEPFMSRFIAAARTAGRRPALVSIGHIGQAGAALWEQLRRDYSAQVELLALGPSSPEDISALMLIADFGVTANPWHLMGKSGTAAAMLDHGLPVVVTRPGVPVAEPSSWPADPLVLRADESLEARLAAGLPRRPPRARIEDVARAFLRAQPPA